MNRFIIKGPKPLKGEVIISGSKNAALPILFSSLLTNEIIIIKNIPKIKDVEVTIKLLSSIGIEIYHNQYVYINPRTIRSNYKISKNLVKSIRASIWILGPLLIRFGKVKIPFPGGCKIGKRPIDLHIKGLKSLGVKIKLHKNYIIAFKNKNIYGTTIKMNKSSVGATLTIMITATLAIGITTICNAAKEPEITDTANFLIKLGAKICGAGTSTIIIVGVKILNGGIYHILPDRIETGTFLVAAAISQGYIICHKTYSKNLESVLEKLIESGAKIKIGTDWISLNMEKKRPLPVMICTGPYPEFPTDMQAPFSLLNAIADGKGTIKETIFENRFMHIPELIRMGALAKIQKNQVTFYGVKKLIGKSVTAMDLRGAITLVLAGCISHGTTTIKKIYHIDRGYSCIEKKLKNIGANILRVT